MRARRPSDWAVDLGGRHELETTVRSALAGHPDLLLLCSSTNSLERLDYQLEYSGRFVELELKAKNQQLSQGWQQLRPEVREADLFVIDELALRKITDAGRFAFLLVLGCPEPTMGAVVVGRPLGRQSAPPYPLARHPRRQDERQAPVRYF